MNREEELVKKWGPIPSQSDEDLKKIAKDIYNGLIYTDRHCQEYEITRRFMILMFMGPQAPSTPKYPNETHSVENDRDNAIYDVIQRDADNAKWVEDMEWYKVEKKYYEENQLPSIGLIYEYMNQAGPMALNAGPMFMSARFLNKIDTEKMFGYYEQYKKLRESVDNF